MFKRNRKKYQPPMAEESFAPAQVPARPAVATALGIPSAQQAMQAQVMPNNCQYAVVGNNMPMGLAQYTTVDEYGRTYSPIMSYAPQPNSAPVPVATPSAIVQLTPIVTPISIVPYATQNQALYQYEDEN